MPTTSCSPCKEVAEKQQLARLIKLASRSARAALAAPHWTQKILLVEGKPMTRTPRWRHNLNVLDPQDRSSSGKWRDELTHSHDVDDHPGNKTLMKHLSDTRTSWRLPIAKGYCTSG
jgi:hypothetical protein